MSPLAKPSDKPRPLLGVPRNGRGQPLVIPIDGGKPVALSRVTTFAKAIDDKEALIDYTARYAIRGVLLDPSLQSGVLDWDPDEKEGKAEFRKLVERAKERAGANHKRDAGTRLHGYSELVDGGVPLPEDITRSDAIDMASYAMRTADLKMIHIEKFVVNPRFNVGGTPDRVVWYSGPGPDGKHIEGYFIGDLKTGNTAYGQLTIMVQLACYSGGFFYDWSMFPVDVTDAKAFAKWKKTEVPEEEAFKAYSPLGDINQRWGIIFRLPLGGGETYLDWAPLAVGYEGAELAEMTRRLRGKKYLIPFQNTPDHDAVFAA
jgi:hypothetical protein